MTDPTTTSHDDVDLFPEPAIAPNTRRRRFSLAKRGEVVVGGALILFVVLVAIIVPLVEPTAATAIKPDLSLAPPGPDVLLGADQLGRSLLARLAEGYRISLTISLGAVLFSVIVGGVLGLLAATSPRGVDGLIMRLLDVVMAFPALLLAIVVVALFGSGTIVLLFAIGIVYVPIMARVMRAAALQTAQQEFVESARARGARRARIIFLHIAPNSLGPLVVQASILVGLGIILEAALSFVGLGVQPPTPSLGLMLSQGRDYMSTSPWVVADPAVAIFIAVLAFTLLGDGLQSWLDPQRRTVTR
jgi:peptide/nickel transport system permease protein